MAPAERPHVICHMTSSVDGRIKVRRWKTLDADSHYERIHAELKGDAWMCGRVTMQGYADSAEKLPDAILDDTSPVPREDHVARRDASGYAVALDARGRLDWGARNEIEGDHVVVVLTESVPDQHLRALRAGNPTSSRATARWISLRHWRSCGRCSGSSASWSRAAATSTVRC